MRPAVLPRPGPPTCHKSCHPASSIPTGSRLLPAVCSRSPPAAVGCRQRRRPAAGGRRPPPLTWTGSGQLTSLAQSDPGAQVPGLASALETAEHMKWSWFNADSMLFMQILCQIYAVLAQYAKKMQKNWKKRPNMKNKKPKYAKVCPKYAENMQVLQTILTK